MKITRAMEMIAASRVNRAQQRAKAAVPYQEELIRAVGAVAGHTSEAHPLTRESKNPVRSAVLVMAGDQGLAGAFNSNVCRAGEGLIKKLQGEGKQVKLFTEGKHAGEYFEFRGHDVEARWDGYSSKPRYRDAKAIGIRLIKEFLTPVEDGGVDELHLVFTMFNSMVSQQVRVTRLLPLQIVDYSEYVDVAAEADAESFDEYTFEPDPDTVLNRLLPMYVISRIRFSLMESAASELAGRQQAMHSATDNAKQLIDQLTRDANQARQAEITQEINEIVGGAGALAAS
jgi:F-type H+-transporting ATPase subunit gamma